MKEKHCDSCGIVEWGDLCHEMLTKYRGQNICGWCKFKWRELEEESGKTIIFDKFIKEVKPKKKRT